MRLNVIALVASSALLPMLLLLLLSRETSAARDGRAPMHRPHAFGVSRSDRWASLMAAAQKARSLPAESQSRLHSKLIGRVPPTASGDANINCTTTRLCDNGVFCRDVCSRGSVQFDEWAAQSLAFQRSLQSALPLNENDMLCTHNSAITYASGLGLEDDALTSLVQLFAPNSSVRTCNQLMSLTDQLNGGVRQIELDVHYHNDDIRICHAGGVHLQWLNDWIDELSRELNTTIRWDSETLGCFAVPDDVDGAHEVHASDAMREIRAWMDRPENAKEVVVIMFDDQSDLQKWGVLDLLLQPLAEIFGDITLTPALKQQLYPETDPSKPNWPSPADMLRLGKRVVFASCTDYGADMANWVFYKYGTGQGNFANWQETSPSQLSNYPDCKLADSSLFTPGPSISRILWDSTIFGPFKPADTDPVNATRLQDMMRCNVRFPCMDQTTPDLLSAAVWSWAVGEPSIRGSASCAGMVADGAGHWKAFAAGSGKGLVACKDDSSGAWSVTSTPVACDWGALQSACPAGSSFAVPTNGYENTLLRDAASAAGATHGVVAWVNVSP